MDKKQIKISEEDIKKKLYGTFYKEEEVEPEKNIRIVEDPVVQKKIKPKPREERAPVANPVSPVPPAVRAKSHDENIANELKQLKASIAKLEEKLRSSETKRERLKVKLLQKRKLINIREKFVELVFVKLLPKLPFFVGILLVFFLILAILKPRPKPAVEPVSLKPQAQIEAPIVTEKPEAIVKEKENVKPKPAAMEVKSGYTIQVAEYADSQAASRFVDQLKEKGIDVYMDTIYRSGDPEKPYFKINIGRFPTFQDARAYNETIKSELKIKDAFIKEIK